MGFGLSILLCLYLLLLYNTVCYVFIHIICIYIYIYTYIYIYALIFGSSGTPTAKETRAAVLPRLSPPARSASPAAHRDRWPFSPAGLRGRRQASSGIRLFFSWIQSPMF